MVARRLWLDRRVAPDRRLWSGRLSAGNVTVLCNHGTVTETVGELSSEATDVYRVLADRGAQPADALAQTLSLAVGDVDDAVEELESAGLVEAAPVAPPTSGLVKKRLCMAC